MQKTIKIGKKYIGPGHPCFIIAEAGVNHNGDIDLAFKLVDAANEAGADAIKFQSFITEDLITRTAPKAKYQTMTTDQSESQYSMLKNLELSQHEHKILKEYCDKNEIIYMCTPYEFKSAKMLNSMGVQVFKIASTDLTNIPFLRYLATLQKPLILSTGMSSLEEIEYVVNDMNNNGLEGEFILMHCTSEYPAPLSELNLRAIQTINRTFKCLVGYSDHSQNIGASPWAVILGACVIEKHFTLDKSMKGPDHLASIEPKELKQLIITIRNVEAALGNGNKEITECEKRNKPFMQKSLVASHDIKAGKLITEDDLCCKRPATGISPLYIDNIIGKKALKDIKKDEIITYSLLLLDGEN